MRRTKQLYEIVQAYEQQIKGMQSQIDGLQSRIFSTTYLPSKLNPLIKNTCEYQAVLGVKDMIEATSRYVTEIPELNLPSNRIECLLYDYGSICLFKPLGGSSAKLGMFAKTGDLNGLGDLKEIIPIDFAGHSYEDKYNVVYNNNLTSNAAVIMSDYTGTYREDAILPRRVINSVSINDQALVYQKMRDAILLTAKKAIALIENETQRSAIEQSLNDFFQNASPVATVVGGALSDVFKVFNLDTKFEIEGYMRAIENYERIRSNFNGIYTQPSQDKKERNVVAEVKNADCLTEIMLYDGYFNRITALELAKIHGIIKDYSCKINEKLLSRESSNSNKKEEE